MNKINHKWHKEMLMGQWSNSLEIRTYISGFPCNAANWPSKLKSNNNHSIMNFYASKTAFHVFATVLYSWAKHFYYYSHTTSLRPGVPANCWRRSLRKFWGGERGQYCYYSVPWDQYCWHARLRYSCMVAKMLQKLKLGWSIYLSLGVPVLARLATEKKIICYQKGLFKNATNMQINRFGPP